MTFQKMCKCLWFKWKGIWHMRFLSRHPFSMKRMRHIAHTMVWHSRSKVIGKKWEIFLEVCWHKIFAARSISRCKPQIVHSSWLIHVHFIELAWGNIVLAVVVVFFFANFMLKLYARSINMQKRTSPRGEVQNAITWSLSMHINK